MVGLVVVHAAGGASTCEKNEAEAEGAEEEGRSREECRRDDTPTLTVPTDVVLADLGSLVPLPLVTGGGKAIVGTPAAADIGGFPIAENRDGNGPSPSSCRGMAVADHHRGSPSPSCRGPVPSCMVPVQLGGLTGEFGRVVIHGQCGGGSSSAVPGRLPFPLSSSSHRLAGRACLSVYSGRPTALSPLPPPRRVSEDMPNEIPF